MKHGAIINDILHIEGMSRSIIRPSNSIFRILLNLRSISHISKQVPLLHIIVLILCYERDGLIGV